MSDAVVFMQVLNDTQLILKLCFIILILFIKPYAADIAELPIYTMLSDMLKTLIYATNIWCVANLRHE